MSCRVVQTLNGAAIICSRGFRGVSPPCWECPRPGIFLCDGLTGLATCDRRLCVHHRVNAGIEVDFCRDCAVGIGFL